MTYHPTPTVTYEGSGIYAIKIEAGTMRAARDGAILFLTEGPPGLHHFEAEQLVHDATPPEPEVVPSPQAQADDALFAAKVLRDVETVAANLAHPDLGRTDIGTRHRALDIGNLRERITSGAGAIAAALLLDDHPDSLWMLMVGIEATSIEGDPPAWLLDATVDDLEAMYETGGAA